LAEIAHPLYLSGAAVTLVPLEAQHIAPLMQIAQASPERFRYTSTPTTPAEADAYFGRAFREREQGRAYPFALLAGGEVVGTSRYADISYANRNCELGFTWLAPPVQGGSVNVESKYLLLRHAFETLDFLRVYFYTDARNAQSRRAIEKLGAHYEGTLRAERVMKDGHIRDTLLFSVIHSEWPVVKKGLEARLAARLGSTKDAADSAMAPATGSGTGSASS
jgi:RimJ/RimL family protein N-acetyltransferase